MVNNERVNSDNDSRKIITMIVMVCALMICTTGATYAYFAVSAVNSVATGEAATVDLSLNVTKVNPTESEWNASTQVMVPQLDAGLGTAMSTDHYCVDTNGNVICQVYKITIENKSTSAVRLRGAVYFTLATGAVYTNLYWRQVPTANTLGTNTTFKYSTVEATNSTTADAANSTLAGDLLLAKADATANSGTDYAEYFVLIWIREMNVDQRDTDKGVWTMNVSFKDKVNGTGVTSTILS